mmetsp:Transcript_35294/g.69236  ORF Transcript_35294/g.69236 Transcript_35294/m.69236 type:complete len:80 (+) Transcript_35294:350-589(+)|eukprot:CAMPEP_0175171382 /NCGR_PEP_ID=MMETSP0087-20121206/30801_1 /TAXON_ID=136419 /ORGANISM="Unknown Unknown, Strain D1" /LENGTH=79 /DNA_ID=CAMNT_0016462245 /DNA_START=258 /DNA_END=497 /DNA_ORIENTATION=-
MAGRADTHSHQSPEEEDDDRDDDDDSDVVDEADQEKKEKEEGVAVGSGPVKTSICACSEIANSETMATNTIARVAARPL